MGGTTATVGQAAGVVVAQARVCKLRVHCLPPHGPPFGPVRPGRQRHSVESVERTVAVVVPAGHAVQVTLPTVGLNVPTGQPAVIRYMHCGRVSAEGSGAGTALTWLMYLCRCLSMRPEKFQWSTNWRSE